MPIPRDASFDGSLAMLSDPYQFIAKRCHRNGSDAFATRIMLRRAICVSGEDAARMFYVPNRFTRRGAIPITVLTLLQDRGSAATLDAEAHRHRKGMLMSIMTRTNVVDLTDRVDLEWRRQAAMWEGMREVEFVSQAQQILTRAVCAWAGLALSDSDAHQRARELSSMYEGAGAFGPRNWRGQLLRAKTERWLRRVVEEARSGQRPLPAGSPADVVARHRELDGTLLDVVHAAVEIVNLLRPTVAVERYLTFAALALHEHPECRARIAAGDDDAYVGRFVQEVRRFYPFFPMVGGRARDAFEWRGERIEPGTWVLLDLYGTNHDARRWDEPDRFEPDRFLVRPPNAFDLIPQGGGDHLENHRCAGEALTLEIMRRVIGLLAREMQYDVPRQDLRIDMSRMPAVPRSRFVMSNVRMVARSAERHARTA
jgi:fatty-acid peroxygenase